MEPRMTIRSDLFSYFTCLNATSFILLVMMIAEAITLTKTTWPTTTNNDDEMMTRTMSMTPMTTSMTSIQWIIDYCDSDDGDDGNNDCDDDVDEEINCDDDIYRRWNPQPFMVHNFRLSSVRQKEEFFRVGVKWVNFWHIFQNEWTSTEASKVAVVVVWCALLSDALWERT